MARVGINDERLNKTQRFFAQYGPEIVIVARFVPVFRQLNGIVAGSVAMGWQHFASYNALDGLLWVGAWSFGMYYFGDQIKVWLLRFHMTTLWLAGALALALGLLIAVAYRIFSKRRNR